MSHRSPPPDPTRQDSQRVAFGQLARYLPQEVEVAALIRLQHMLQIEPSVSTRVLGLRGNPPKPSALEFRPRDVQVDPTFLDVDGDGVAVLYERERAAHCGFRRDMQHDGAECGTAHPRVRDPNQVGDAPFQQLLRDRDLTSPTISESNHRQLSTGKT